jgi:hypothetical protein
MFMIADIVLANMFHGMRRGSIRKLSKGLFALLLLGCIVSIPLGVIGYLAKLEHDRREDVLAHGALAMGTVTEAKWIGRGCAFSYNFVYRGNTYRGGEGGCRLIATHPRGARLPVRFAIADPGNSVAIGADHWPAWGIVPVLLAMPLLVLGLVIAYAVITDAFRAPRSRNSPRRNHEK